MPTKIDTKKKAKLIRDKAYSEKREEQYQMLLDWKYGKTTGLECIQEIITRDNIIKISKEDMNMKLPGVPPKGEA